MHALSQYSYTTPELGQQQIFRKNWRILKQAIKKLRSKYKMERNKKWPSLREDSSAKIKKLKSKTATEVIRKSDEDGESPPVRKEAPTIVINSH